MLLVKDLMTEHPVTISLSEKAGKAISLMAEANVGSVIVVEDDNPRKPVDILTERDALRILLYGYSKLSVKDVLKQLKKKKHLITISPDASIFDAMKIFENKGIKHFPVVDEKGLLIGIISAGDVLRKITPMAFIDPLTKLSNKNLVKTLYIKFKRRKNSLASVLMIDIDDFKKINDSFGHVVGDKVLKEVANAIVCNIRNHDEAIRYGGEEFLVVLYRINEENALMVAERIRARIEQIKIKDYPDLKVTASIGVCSFKGGGDTFLEAIEKADHALYKAKALGKNRVVMFG